MLGSARAQTPSPASAQLGPAAKVIDAARDDTGRVWAIVGRETGAPPALCRWTGMGWKPASVSLPAPPFIPDALRALPGGGVGVAWDGPNNAHSLFILRGDLSRAAAKWTGPLQMPRVFGAKNGDVFVTGAGGDIYRADARVGGTGKVEHIYDPDKSHAPADRGNGNPLLSDAPEMVEDGVGGCWFWTPSLLVGNDPPQPLPLLRFWKGMLAPTVIKDLLPDPVGCVATRDARHMWLAVRDKGIFEVDVLQMSAQFVPSPQADAFRRVQTMGLFGTRFGVVTGQNGDDNRSGVLWLWTTDGWNRAIAGLDTQPAFHDLLHRPAVTTPLGTWIGSYGAGVWLLPSSGPPKLLDWRVGFALPSSDRLVTTPPAVSGLLALSIDRQNGAAASPAVHLERLVAVKPDTSVATVAPLLPLAQTPNGHIWLLDAVRLSPAVLREWDGSGHWKAYPLPGDASQRRFTALRAGQDGRVWCVSAGRRGGPAAFAYTPDSGAWATQPPDQVPPAAPSLPRPRKAALPTLAPPPDPGSLARAADGSVWLTSGHVLYHVTADGKTVPAFADKTPTPFADGRRVVATLTDPQGLTFVRTVLGAHAEYVLVPKR